MARVRIGKPVERSQKQRIEKIYNSIFKLVKDGKLICPQSEQRNELNRERDAFNDIALRLSLGVETKAYTDIANYQ